MNSLYRNRLLATTLFFSASALASPAWAQENQDAADEPGEEIVVTGTLLRNPNLEQSTPVNATTADTIELQQSNLAEEVLREVPGVVPNVGSAVNNGNGGASFVDLRGLGANRNLVLLDGNRLVPAGLAGTVDLNNIPLALVERVDALTGAAVTTYGADAITGVVNFVTRRNFSGAEINVSEQLTEQGDGNYVRGDLTVGGNFGDGRGNAVISLGYQQSDEVSQGDREFSVFQVDSFNGTNAGSGTSVPSRFSGTRKIDPATCLIVGNDPKNGNQGASQIDTRDNAACPNAAITTFNFFNFNPFNVFQTPFKRYNLFAQANYEISDAVEVYGRGLFSKNVVSTIIAPSGSFGGPVTVNLNNPFLSDTLRNQFCAFDVNPSKTVYQARFTQAECDAAKTAVNAADPNYREVGANSVFVSADVDGDGNIDEGEGFNSNPGVTLNRRTTEVGPRISDFTTTVFDMRLGLRGPLTDSIDWDVAASYGESNNFQLIQNFVLQSRVRQSILVNGTAANPVCADTSNGCVAVDWFGPEGSITAAGADFLSDNSNTTISTALGQVRGIISGDTGFNLPWATQQVGFAVGAEYRKYKAEQSSDVLAKTAGELGGGGAAALDFKGAYQAAEGYAELVVPIAEDRPFFESLTAEAGLRYSDYKVDGGGSFDTLTYKIGGSWEPQDGIKFRGNYSHAVRAPNINELFTPPVTGLTNLGIDPCAGAAPENNADLKAICLAQGAPAGTIGLITNPTAGQANVTASGSLDLQPEKANTWTIGAVLQPAFLPNFSVSIDYYNIKVKDVIGAPTSGDLIDACFGNISAASASNPACTSIRRNPLTGGLDGDPSITPGLFAPTTNLGKLFTDGVDLIADYRTDVGFGKLDLSFVGNYTRNSEFNSNAKSATGFDRECAGFYSPNCSFTGSIQPKFQFTQRTTFTMGKVDLSLLWRWIDAVKYEPRQFEDELAAAAAANLDEDGNLLPIADQGCPNFATTDEGGCIVQEEFRNIGAKSYFDLTARFNATRNMTFVVTVQNLFDLKPKVVGNTIGTTAFNSGNVFPSTYDALGRRYAVSAKLKF